ncbi:MFS transporter [Thermosinus carboxydivorans]|uniref:MFS transporter n=1 Tax=Thermosinus carboxydivorans TaxID=261685 RepID=UPI0018DB6324|nr:MFS transporter [Thermosinus carboxydivorans]
MSFAGQALAGSVLTLGVLRGVSGLFIGAMLPSVNALISLLIPSAKRGVAFGVTTAASQMGNVLGPVIGGAIALSLSIPAVFWLTASLFAIVAVWVAWRVRDPRLQECENLN